MHGLLRMAVCPTSVPQVSASFLPHRPCKNARWMNGTLYVSQQPSLRCPSLHSNVPLILSHCLVPEFPNTGRGAAASKDLQPGDVAVEIPEKLLIHSDVAKQSPLVRDHPRPHHRPPTRFKIQDVHHTAPSLLPHGRGRPSSSAAFRWRVTPCRCCGPSESKPTPSPASPPSSEPFPVHFTPVSIAIFRPFGSLLHCFRHTSAPAPATSV